MPYIITRGIPTTGAGTSFASHAVATIEEAREHAKREIEDRDELSQQDMSDLASRCEAMTSTGVLIGPLPDGFVIEVAKATWEHLAFRTRMKPQFVRVHGHGGDIAALHAEILDAFNAT